MSGDPVQHPGERPGLVGRHATIEEVGPQARSGRPVQCRRDVAVGTPAARPGPGGADRRRPTTLTGSDGQGSSTTLSPWRRASTPAPSSGPSPRWPLPGPRYGPTPAARGARTAGRAVAAGGRARARARPARPARGRVAPSRSRRRCGAARCGWRRGRAASGRRGSARGRGVPRRRRTRPSTAHGALSTRSGGRRDAPGRTGSSTPLRHGAPRGRRRRSPVG